EELQARQIRGGERILLQGPNCAEWVGAFLGCALRRVVCVPIDRVASPEFVGRVAQQTQARLIVGSDAAAWGIPALSFAQLAGLPRASCMRPAMEPAPQDPLEIVFTSGTTAEPRGVVISHANVLANVSPLEREIGKYLRYERFLHPLRFLSLLPL